MVVNIDIKIAITIIEFVFAPTQMIKSGPSDTFGKEFRTVKYGSNILAIFLLAQKMLAIKIPKVLAVVKLIIVSYRV